MNRAVLAPLAPDVSGFLSLALPEASTPTAESSNLFSELLSGLVDGVEAETSSKEQDGETEKQDEATPFAFPVFSCWNIVVPEVEDHSAIVEKATVALPLAETPDAAELPVHAAASVIQPNTDVDNAEPAVLPIATAVPAAEGVPTAADVPRATGIPGANKNVPTPIPVAQPATTSPQHTETVTRPAQPTDPEIVKATPAPPPAREAVTDMRPQGTGAEAFEKSEFERPAGVGSKSVPPTSEPLEKASPRRAQEITNPQPIQTTPIESSEPDFQVAGSRPAVPWRSTQTAEPVEPARSVDAPAPPESEAPEFDPTTLETAPWRDAPGVRETTGRSTQPPTTRVPESPSSDPSETRPSAGNPSVHDMKAAMPAPAAQQPQKPEAPVQSQPEPQAAPTQRAAVPQGAPAFETSTHVVPSEPTRPGRTPRHEAFRMTATPERRGSETAPFVPGDAGRTAPVESRPEVNFRSTLQESGTGSMPEEHADLEVAAELSTETLKEMQPDARGVLFGREAGAPARVSSQRAEAPAVPRAMWVEDQPEPVAPTTPLRDLTVRIPSESNPNETIAVRFTQRGEGINVGVRASQPEVAQTLHRELPELMEGLKREGFRSEVASSTVSTLSATNSSSSSSAESDAQNGQHRHARQFEEREEQRNRKPKQPFEGENDE